MSTPDIKRVLEDYATLEKNRPVSPRDRKESLLHKLKFLLSSSCGENEISKVMSFVNEALFLEREICANLYESVDPASDMERINGDPGCGAMGAVIEFRDKIRELT